MSVDNIIKELETGFAIVESEIQHQEQLQIIRWGWANERLKNWFWTKAENSPAPFGSILFVRAGCLPSDQNIRIKETYPTVGDIISDVEGRFWEIISLEWI